jgi:hypothetical protein
LPYGGASSGIPLYLRPGFLQGAGSAIGGLGQAYAGQQAAGTQAAAADRAAALQERIYNSMAMRNLPAESAGTLARDRYLELIGLGPNTNAMGYGSANQPFTMQGYNPNALPSNFSQADLEADVIRQDAFRNANRISDRTFSSRGLFQSPQRAMAEMSNRLNTGEGALRRFQENRASQAGLFADAYNRDRTRQLDEFSRLGGLMTSGQNAAAGTGASQAAYGSNAANLMSQGAQAMGQGVLGAGQAIGAGQMGAGNTYNNAINAALQGYQNNQMMDLFRDRQSANRQSSYTPQQAAPFDPYGRFNYPDRA